MAGQGQAVSLEKAHTVEIAGGVNETQLEGIAIVLAKAAIEGRALIVSCKGGATHGKMADRHDVLSKFIKEQGVISQRPKHLPEELVAGVVYLVPYASAVGQSYMLITSNGGNGHRYMVTAQQFIQEGYSVLEKMLQKR